MLEVFKNILLGVNIVLARGYISDFYCILLSKGHLLLDGPLNDLRENFEGEDTPDNESRVSQIEEIVKHFGGFNILDPSQTCGISGRIGETVDVS